MNALILFAEAQGGGQIEQIARTFGVDWPHLIAQTISFSIVCFILYLLAYKPVLRMLTARRELIAQGLANSEKIKAELAKTEAQRQEVMAQAGAQANQFIEEARSAAARLRDSEDPKGHRCRGTDHGQGKRGRCSGPHSHAGTTQTRGGPVGGADHRCYHRQDFDHGGSAASG